MSDTTLRDKLAQIIERAQPGRGLTNRTKSANMKACQQKEKK